MRFVHLPLVFIAACGTFQSCQKETATDDAAATTATEAATETCPSLGAEVAHLEEITREKTKQLLNYFTADQLSDLRANVCLTKDFLVDENVSGEAADDRASGAKNRFWSPGQQIRIRFLNGSNALQTKVLNYAKEWENYANIQFTKVTSGASEVRVMFGDDGHWSYIGTDNLSIEACDKTMNLALVDNTSAAEIRRVSLHEFGHVLGMRHEHQQPLASIAWNSTAVYNYYAQQDWGKQDVDDQILTKNTAESTQYTAFDAQSIMEYAVPASLTSNGSSIGWNTQLSAVDKSYISMMYSSKRTKVRHAATGYNASITFLLDGIYHTVKAGETLSVPVYTSGNQLSIREASGSWDSAYAPVYGKNYKIVRTGSSNDLTLVAE